MIGLTPEWEIALLSYYQPSTGWRGVTDLVVIRVIDQTVLSINEDPVKSSTVDDTLGKWCRGVSDGKQTARARKGGST
jgi:hypothetical protein